MVAINSNMAVNKSVSSKFMQGTQEQFAIKLHQHEVNRQFLSQYILTDTKLLRCVCEEAYPRKTNMFPARWTVINIARGMAQQYRCVRNIFCCNSLFPYIFLSL